MYLPLSQDKEIAGQGKIFVPGQKDNRTSRPGLSRNILRKVPSIENPCTNPNLHNVEYHQATTPSSFILFGSEKAQRKAKRGWQREISKGQQDVPSRVPDCPGMSRPLETLVQTLFHTTLSIIKLPLLLLLSSLGQKRHKGKLSAAGKKRYQLTFHSENPELKSVNLQYITLGCWADGTNESSTKRLIFQV